jgi:hypothetical protein
MSMSNQGLWARVLAAMSGCFVAMTAWVWADPPPAPAGQDGPPQLPFVPASRAAEAIAISGFPTPPTGEVPLWRTWIPSTGQQTAPRPFVVPVGTLQSPISLTTGSHQMTGWRSTAQHGNFGVQHDANYSYVRLPLGSSDLAPGVPRGSRINLNVVAAPAPGDFLSPSPTLGGSSVALLPPNSAGASTWWQSASRPTLHGVVDLVTGVPLAQVTDMELPFGSATFRLNRTRSATPQSMQGGMSISHAACDRWWDWTGMGWMASENPVLLIDSAVPDLVGERERTTWLWLDAHHAIPFQRVTHTQSGSPPRFEYEAPPRFRARLKHNGVVGNIAINQSEPRYGWTTRPTKFEISLYDGALTYTFLPVYENVPPHVWKSSYEGIGTGDFEVSDFHERPLMMAAFIRALGQSQQLGDPYAGHNEFSSEQNPGLGLPYVGLLWRIEDRHGHRAEMTYEPVRRTPLDLNPTDHLTDYVEDGAAFGALRSVKLSSRSAAGSYTVHWTLMYSYVRHAAGGFGLIPANATEVPPPLLPLASTLSVDEIRAFRGDLIDHQDDAKWRLIRDAGAAGGAAWPSQPSWKRKVRYHYAPSRASEPTVPVPPLLVKTEMHNLDSGTTDDPGQIRLYWMDLSMDGSLVVFNNTKKQAPWLRAIFEHADVEDLRRARPNQSEAWRAKIASPFGAEWVNTDDQAELAKFASVEWRNSPGAAALGREPLGTFVAPDYATLHSDIRLMSDRLRWDLGPDTVNHVAIRTPRGHHRYQVIRLLHDSVASGLELQARNVPETYINSAPGRSMLLAPFVFRAHFPLYSGQIGNAPMAGDPNLSLQASGTLSEPRFVTVIDSLSDPAIDPVTRQPVNGTWADPVAYDGSGLTRGQTGRRVVQINPAGYILRDRNIVVGKGTLGEPVRLGPDAGNTGQPNQVGGGLGEEFIYRTPQQLFPGIPAGDWAAMQPPGLKDELFKAERRTIGWSAAERLGGTAPAQSGLVEYWDYRLVDVVGGAPNEKRVELAQQGTQRGIGSGTSQPQAKSASFLVVEGEFEATTFHARVDFSTFLTPVQAEGLRRTILSKTDLQNFLLDMASDGHRVSASLTVHRAPEPSVTPLPSLRQRPVAETWSLGTPRPITPAALGTPASWKFPVTRQLFTADGRSEWSLVAMVANPLTATPSPVNTTGDIVMLTYTAFWEEHDPSASNNPPPGYTGEAIGRPRHIVVDARPGEAHRRHLWVGENAGPTPSGPQVPVRVMIPQPPSGFWLPTAAPAGAVPQITSMYYDRWGVTDTVHPDGRLTMRRIRLAQQPPSDAEPNPKPFAREFILNDVALVGTSGNAWRAFGESQVNDYASRQPIGEPMVRRRGTWLANIDPGTQVHDAFALRPDPSAPQGAATFAQTAEEKLALDNDGRVQRAAAMEWVDGQGKRAVGSTLVNDLGEVHRTLELDSTVTRLTRNALGQTLRRYVGTADLDWGESLPVSSSNFNMVLVERHEYGMGINDAWQPTVRWTYTSHPTWAQAAYGPPPASTADDAGTATVTGYDWRMRPVKQERFAKGPVLPTSKRTSTTLRYLDHLGHERLVVTLGTTSGHVPAEVDPTRFSLNGIPEIPAPSAFADLNPISVVETFYFADGLVRERVRYDVANLASGAFHTEHTYFGIAGAETYWYASGQPLRLTTLDGHGRPAVVSTWAMAASGLLGAGTELTRSETTYDAVGNVVRTRFTDRSDAATGAITSGTPAEVRITRNFYDPLRRLMARVDGDAPPGLISILTETVDDARTPPPSGEPPSGPPPLPALPPPSLVGSGLPTAPTTLYWYNRTGQQVAMQDPNGIVTRQRFGWNGQLESMTENATVADGSPSTNGQQRQTQHFSRLGRLEGVSSGEPGGVKTGEWFKYGAEVVDDTFAVVSAHGGLIGSVYSGVIPDAFTARGPPSGMRERLRFRYTFDGLIAERISRSDRGEVAVSLRYTYDDQQRLTRVQAGWYSSGSTLAPSNWQAGFADGVAVLAVVGASNEQEYMYDDRGNLVRTRSRQVIGSTSEIVSEAAFRYDLRGRLTGERIAHDGPFPAGGPWLAGGDPADAVIYVWSWQGEGQGGSAHHRLERIGYPHHENMDVGGDRRWVEVGYDANHAAVSQVLSRPTELMTWTGVRTPAGELAAARATYTGSGNRLETRLLGSRSTNSTTAPFTYKIQGQNGRDGLGRLTMRSWSRGTGGPVYQQLNTYDAGGRRVQSAIKRSHPNDPTGMGWVGEQVEETYDRLGRLHTSTLSKWPEGASAWQAWRTDTWALDVHGHWAGALPATADRYGRSTTNPEGLRQVTVPTGTTRTIAWSGVAPAADQTINQAWTGTNAQSAGQAEGAGFGMAPVEDGAGNVRFCGEFLYAFDAWNRLVAVWKARPDATFNANSRRPRADAPQDGMEVGNWVKRFRYDALGRLIEAKSPMAGPEWPNSKLERVEKFWYDGSRRIQEVVEDPIDLLYVVNKYGTEGLVEYIQTGLITAAQGAATGFPYRALNREYIWGMGVGGGVDELHVYFDRDRQPWGVLQDSDGDNVAVVDAGGNVNAEFVYDPYGAVIGQRTYGVHPPLKSGHRGLFAESLTVGTVGTPDADLGDPIETATAWVDGRVLVPNERLLYHMRNRAYDPGPSGATAGRFIQRDPNASGAVLYSGGGGLGSHGAAPVAMVTGLDLAGHVTDGVNTYGYLRGRMRGAGDPSGLWREEAANNALEIAGLFSPLPGPGDFLRGMLGAVASEYSANLSWDADWAMDWSQDDNWHTRGDNSWVTIAIGQGLYSSFDIDLPFTDASLNPLDMFASGSGTPAPDVLPGDNGGLDNVMKKPIQGHHIASPLGGNAARVNKLFTDAGMTVNDGPNLVDIPHSGRHNRAYHEFVFRQLEKAVQGLTTKAARKVALTNELNRLGTFIRQNPHFMYNSSGKRSTGWRGMRTFVQPDQFGAYRYMGPKK